MIYHLLDTIAPVFLLVLGGSIAVKGELFDAATIDALMRYAIRFAIPCLLFRAVSGLDLGAAYEWRPMVSYYGAALVSFALATFVAWRVFGRRPGEAVAVGFGGLFSNLVLLGLPIVDLRLGAEALPTAYALVSVHAPFCYLVGIVAMEVLRADGRALSETAVVVARAMFRNNLMIGIALGFAVNLGHLPVPGALGGALDMVGTSALPLALVALGGVLARYSPTERIAETGAVTAVSLVLHPLLAFAACTVLGVPGNDRAVVVLMASKPPGINVYLFANLYGRGERTAAATVLIGTLAAAFGIGFWAWLLAVA